MAEPNLPALRTLAAHCRRCKHRVGEYVEGGTAIQFGRDGDAVRIRQRLTFFCRCGGRNSFRPGKVTNERSG